LADNFGDTLPFNSTVASACEHFTSAKTDI
jgi:hypothetical protein